MQREDKILVVEDNPVICRSIEAAYACDCATDGWDAISKLESHDYAAIVIDTDVPSRSGFGVITYLREELGNDLPNVILMTSASDREEVRRKVGRSVNVVDREDALHEIARVLDPG